MGLDTYAARMPDEELSDNDIEAFEKADIHLCGGVVSGAAGSFRGKVYSGLISRITGVSLYQEWIPPAVVRKMWQALDQCDPEEFTEDAARPEFSNLATIIELRKFFRVCSERRLGLVGWW